MRKTNLLGATILALTTGAWSLAAVAQTPAPAPAAAPAPTPAPVAAPAPDASPAPDAAPPAADTTAPAPKMAKKHMVHHKAMSAHKGKLAPTKAGDRAVEDLNDASLSSAKSGKPFSPPATPDAAKKEAHMGDAGTSTMHHHMHHKMMKKMDKKADSAAPSDQAAPPADTSATPPADTSAPK